ncbi:MAG: ankyrin repeat domain-containing protein [Armatimonadota bacterium]
MHTLEMALSPPEVTMLQRLIVKWVIGGEIHEAAQAGDLSRVRALLAVEPALAKRCDPKHPQTPLHLAAAQGNAPLAELLLLHGAEINAVDLTTGRTPLHLAAHHGHRQMIRLLLSRGANRSIADRSGLTPLQVAQHAQKTAVAELLLQGMDEPSKD